MKFKFLYFRESDVNFIVMKAILAHYRRFYAVPKEVPDGAVLSHLLVLTVFFFSLGFMVSQIIIFVIEK